MDGASKKWLNLAEVSGQLYTYSYREKRALKKPYDSPFKLTRKNVKSYHSITCKWRQRERMYGEVRSIFSREERRLRERMKRLLDWLSQRRMKEAKWKDERESQLVLCRYTLICKLVSLGGILHSLYCLLFRVKCHDIFGLSINEFQNSYRALLTCPSLSCFLERWCSLMLMIFQNLSKNIQCPFFYIPFMDSCHACHRVM